MRLGVFVDINNQVNAIQEKRKGYRINYERFLEMATGVDDDLVIAICYGLQIADETNSFMYVLKKLGYFTKFSQERSNRNVEITLDIINLIHRLDTVVLGSNSPEFIPLIRQLRISGIKVGIVTPNIIHNEGNYTIDLLMNDDPQNPVIEYIADMRGPK